VGRVSIRFARESWSYKKAISSVAPVRLGLSLPGGRREIWIKPHRGFWLYWWKVLLKEAELASTLMLKRRRGRWYAIFVFDVMPMREPPAEAVAFDVNENWVAVAKVSLLSTVDAVARWNWRYVDPAVYSIETDFGRLAKRYEAVRNAKLEELKQRYPYAGGDDEEKVQNVADTREFRKFVRRLRERRRKEGRIKQIVREIMKSPAVIITEELGKNPQEEMIGLEKTKKGVKKVEKRELRHRIRQTPFKRLVRAVEGKAAEGGSVVVYVSPYRNSKVCPIHFSLLKNGSGWHTLHCPCGHGVDRDHAAVLNMLWKITPEGAAKGVWWDLKNVKRRLEKGRGLVPRELAKRRNPLVPWPVVRAVWTSLMALKAGDKWPAVLARAAPMTPARGAYEGGTRAPPRPKGTPALQGWEEVRMT